MSIFQHAPITWTADTVCDSDAFNTEIKEKMDDIDDQFPVNIYPDKLNLTILMNVTHPTYQIDINADCLILNDTSFIVKAFTSIDLTVSITASGANGLDTGVEAANTWYYIWVIGKADGTKAGLLSISSTAPTMPADYLYKRLIGAIRNDASSNFIPGTWDSGWFNYNVGQQVYSGNGVTSWTDADLSAFMPKAISRMVIVRVFVQTTGNALTFRRNGDTIDYTCGAYLQEYQIVPIDSNGIIEYINFSNAKALTWGVTGYKNII